MKKNHKTLKQYKISSTLAQKIGLNFLNKFYLRLIKSIVKL